MKADIIDFKQPQDTQLQDDPCYASDLIVYYLEQLGVEYIFGIPGGAIEPLFNAIARSERRGGIKAIIARHETGAAFMADAYARNSGKLGVCCSTTGPGATNMITGVASAYENNTPLLVITPQTAQSKFGRKAMQESGDTGVNVVGMYRFCTRFNTLVSHVEQLEHKLITAIMTAMGSPGGPVHLSIPADIMSAELSQRGLSYDLHRVLTQPILQDERAVAQLCAELSAEKKGVFVVGGGCRDAASHIIETANILKAPILATPDGKSFVSPYHPLFRGVIGFAGHSSAEAALKDSDLDFVVVAGVTLGEFTSNAWDQTTLLTEKLIHVDDNESNLMRSPMASLHVRGQISAVFEKVVSHLLGDALDDNKDTSIVDATQRSAESEPGYIRSVNTHSSQIEELIHFTLDEPKKIFDDAIPIKPQWLMHQLTRIFPVNTRYLADTGNNLAWAIHYLNPYDRRIGQRRQGERRDSGRRHFSNALFQVSIEFCSMGWSVGSAVGTALANPGEPVVCIVGDGSFLMFGNEITVALQHRLPVIFLVLNDAALGMVKHGQQLNDSESIGHALPAVDFAAMAESMGIPGYRIAKPSDLLRLNIEVLCQRCGPSVIDVIIDPEEVPPIATRIKGMNSGGQNE